MKYYLIYKITNLLNGKIYIGKHETRDLDDGYMGSGYLIKKAISKYGLSNFQKEILVAINISENNYYLQQNKNGYGAFSGIYGNWKNLITGQTENYNGSINLEPNSFQILEKN